MGSMKFEPLQDTQIVDSRFVEFLFDCSVLLKADLLASAFSIQSAFSIARKTANPTPNTQVKYHILISFQISA